ncbi:MAG: Flagellum site-determining protein YlxH [Phycisphaerae bacterium]|nr:Flagellum site-determining protein YlxH [Phycisphaerae bacterium]
MRDQAWKLRELMNAQTPGSAVGEQGSVETAPAAETAASPSATGEPRPVTTDPRSAVPAPRPRVLAVASGKGGVGKSCVAANVAYCMARAGRRVLLIDADMGLANLDLIMGLTPALNLGHVVEGRADLGATLMEGPGGLLFLPGASGLSHLADLDDARRAGLLAELMDLERSADLIVIDTGAGISRNVIAFAHAADEVMVVTTPEPTAMTDGYALIKVLAREGYDGRVGVLVNQANDRAEGRAVYSRIAKTASRFLGWRVLDLGHLPRDPQVPAAVRARRLVVAMQPRAAVSRELVALAARLSSDSQAVQRANGDRPGLFRRIAGLFF